MLVKFSVGNYKSFKDVATLDMTASAVSEFKDRNVWVSDDEKISLVKSAALYGLNSSGKSNLFKAYKFFRWFTLNSAKGLQNEDIIDVDSFRLSTKTDGEPSFFEVELLIDGTIYIYGFTSTKKAVRSEWLFKKGKGSRKEVFYRKEGDIKFNEKFIDSEVYSGFTRENALYLSVLAQFNHGVGMLVIGGIRNVIYVSGTNYESQFEHTIKKFQEEDTTSIMKKLIAYVDFGFKEIKPVDQKFDLPPALLKSFRNSDLKRILKVNKVRALHTTHAVYDEKRSHVRDVDFSLMEHESLGTQKFVSLLGTLVNALQKPCTVLIDEFDSRMHVFLSSLILRLFNSSTNNPKGAQLIVATHTSNLLSLSIFRRDQIFLIGKNKYGESTLMKLSQSKVLKDDLEAKVRKDASIEKDFLSGKYIGTTDVRDHEQLKLFE